MTFSLISLIYRVGQNHVGIHGILTVFFCRDSIKYTVIYGVHIWFWPTQCIYGIYGRKITKNMVMYSVYTHSSG